MGIAAHDDLYVKHKLIYAKQEAAARPSKGIFPWEPVSEKDFIGTMPCALLDEEKVSI